MNRREFVSASLAAAAPRPRSQRATQIAIVTSARADALERLAASELSKYLQRLYPENEFLISDQLSRTGTSIQIGTPASTPELTRYVPGIDLAQPDSFVVTTHKQREGSPLGVILGGDPRGTLYAVYKLLEELGYGFYLSYDAYPEPRKGPLAIDEWRLADTPLTPERIVFNWHNFLSGCSGWNLADWKVWITQAAKMRFSSIMVHAYGNNPMAAFTHNGRRSPTGYIASTVRGRDWGTQHVNDVRRLIGAGGLFSGSVFGSDAALVPEEQTVEAVTQLMRQAFVFARSRGLNVSFAVDVDTESSNPQELIATLPESAVIKSASGLRLPNPDTPEGLAYFKSRATQLVQNYPEIDQIVLWFRAARTPWISLRPEELPPAWKAEYELALQKDPHLPRDGYTPGLCAISRVVAAFRKILDETGRPHVQLAVGSWAYDYLAAADAFMDRDVKCICIDQWNALVGDAQNTVRQISSHRKVIPIPYAQDDDGGYVGRPFTPFADFASLLKQSGSAGFGILHWTTRPLDLYFKSLSTQGWEETEDQSLAATCEQMAARTFGASARESGGRYLAQWAAEAAMFGRETSDQFMDVLVRDPAGTVARGRQARRSYRYGGPLFVPPGETIALARKRLDLLSAIDVRRLSADGKERLEYFRDFEHFLIGFFTSQSAWEEAREFSNRGDLAEARLALAQCNPEDVIRQYVKMASHGGITRGEEALIISLNLRWLPYIVSTRQALGLDPVRYKFGPTHHEKLAQGAGTNTFYIDEDHRIWKVLGERETGATAFAVEHASEPEICRSGVRIEGPLTLKLAGIMGDRLVPGRYQVVLTFGRSDRGDATATLELRGSAGGPPIAERVDPAGRGRQLTVPVQVSAGQIELLIRPEGGLVSLCAASIRFDGAGVDKDR